MGDGGYLSSAERAAQVALARVRRVDPMVLILDEASAESASRRRILFVDQGRVVAWWPVIGCFRRAAATPPRGWPGLASIRGK